jgi:hypothetical protein
VLEDAESFACVAGPISPISSRKRAAAVGQLELPELLLVGVGERALLVAEELALEQRLGDRRRS